MSSLGRTQSAARTVTRALAPVVCLCLMSVAAARNAAAQSAVLNGGFVTDLSQWRVQTLGSVFDPTRDASGAPTSGSVKYDVFSACQTIVDQCVGSVVAGAAYDFGGKIFIRASRTSPSTVDVLWFAGTACGGSGITRTAGPVVSALGSWLSSDTLGAIAPVGAQSARIIANACAIFTGETQSGNFDELFFRPAGGPIGPPAPVAVPALDGVGLSLLGGLVIAAAAWSLRRNRHTARGARSGCDG